MGGKPVVRASATIPAAGAVELREGLRVTLSGDHRVIDGALGAKFL